MSSNPPSRAIIHVNVRPHSVAEQAYMPSVRRRTTFTAQTRVSSIAAHPEYDLFYQNGKTITQLTLTLFYLGGTSAWQNSDRSNIDNAIAAAMSDSGLNNVVSQYFSSAISSTFRPSSVLSTALPSQITQASTEQMLSTMYQQNQLSGYDYANTVFGFVCPSGAVLTDDGTVTSLQGLGGYHGAVSVSGTTLYYAIVAYAENLANGQQSGIVAFDQPWKNITAALYHEFNEARTDADVNGTLGWISNQIADFNNSQVEIGDAPVFEAGNNLSLVFQEVGLASGNGTVPIQLLWSNAVHGPEGPRSTPDPQASTTPSSGGGSFVGIIIAVIVVLALAVGAYFVFFHH